MSRDIENDLTNTDPADPVNPYGSVRDESAPAADDGTPVVEAMVGDLLVTAQRIMEQVGVVPNNTPDNNTNGFQIYDALVTLIGITSALGPDSITTVELAPDAVETVNILDLNVTLAKLASEVTDLLPTADQKDALQGTDQTPNNGNRYVTSSDPRVVTTDIRSALNGTEGAPSNGNRFVTDDDARVRFQGFADLDITNNPGTSIASGEYPFPFDIQPTDDVDFRVFQIPNTNVAWNIFFADNPSDTWNFIARIEAPFTIPDGYSIWIIFEDEPTIFGKIGFVQQPNSAPGATIQNFINTHGDMNIIFSGSVDGGRGNLISDIGQDGFSGDAKYCFHNFNLPLDVGAVAKLTYIGGLDNMLGLNRVWYLEYFSPARPIG